MAHAWWRVLVTAGNGDGFARIGEFVLHTTVGGANLCVGGSIYRNTEFSSSGDNSAAAAFDGNPATAWAGSITLPPALGYHMAAPVDVGEVVITCRNDGFGPGGAPSAFTVQSSDDGVTWANEWTVTGQTGWVAGQVRTFARPVSTRTVTAVLALPLGKTITASIASSLSAVLRVPLALTSDLDDPEAIALVAPLPLRITATASTASTMRAVLPLPLRVGSQVWHERVALAVLPLPLRATVAFLLVGPRNAEVRGARPYHGTGPSARTIVAHGAAQPTSRGGRGFGTPTLPD